MTAAVRPPQIISTPGLQAVLAEQLESELSFFEGKEHTYQQFQDPNMMMTSGPCPAFLSRLTITKPPLEAILDFDVYVELRLELWILDLDLSFRFWTSTLELLLNDRFSWSAPCQVRIAKRIGVFERLRWW